MEVKEFVKTILKDVTDAVTEVNEENKKANKSYRFYMNNKSDSDKGVDFDLAVVLDKSGEGKIEADVFKIVSGNLQGKLSEQVVNRIKFKVAVFD